MTDVTLTVELSDSEYEAALIMANVLEVSVSEFVKIALEQYLSRHSVRVE